MTDGDPTGGESLPGIGGGTTRVVNVNGRQLLIDDKGNTIRDLGPVTASTDSTPSVDGAGVQFTYVNGRPVRYVQLEDGTYTFQPYQPVPLPVNQTPGHTTSSSTNVSSSTSTNTNLSPQVYQATDGSTHVYNPATGLDTVIAPPGGMTAYQQAQLQNTLDVQKQQESGANARNAATIAGSAANTATTEAGANSRNAASIAGSAADRASQSAFGAWQQENTQGFTSHENALSAAQRAGEFAANYGLQVAQQQTADRQAKIAAAKTFSDLSGAADLTGYDRFLAAGGGDAGNAITLGGSSLTEKGQLGAGRALGAAREPLPTYAAAPTVPTVAPWSPTPWSGYSAAPAAAPTGPFGGAGTATQNLPATIGANGPNTNAAGNLVAPGGQAGTWAPTLGFANGTGAPPIRRQLGSSVTAMPNGGSMDTLTDRYALGTRRNLLGGPPMHAQDDPNAGIPAGFANGTDNAIPTGRSFDAIVGDSTAQDPAAGGAHPEGLQITDPTGDATVDIDPLTTPGVGPTEPEGDSQEMLGALLVALGNFLKSAADKDVPPLGPPPTLGGMGRPRFALGTADLLGTGATDADSANVNEVLAMRQATPYSVSPMRADYAFSDPTQRAINAAAFQTATGVPSSELDYVNQRYQPGGLGRGSTYNRDLSLGI